MLKLQVIDKLWQFLFFLMSFQSDDEIIYKNKYFTLLDAMKQLQNTFLKAQKNAERNVKGQIYKYIL